MTPELTKITAALAASFRSCAEHEDKMLSVVSALCNYPAPTESANTGGYHVKSTSEESPKNQLAWHGPSERLATPFQGQPT